MILSIITKRFAPFGSASHRGGWDEDEANLNGFFSGLAATLSINH
jgi:hypothetical protein